MFRSTHNSHITCRNVQDYLEVRAIKFRETRTYEKPGQFTVEIHKIEELNLTKIEGIDSVTGRTGGNGKLWYEFEVRPVTFYVAFYSPPPLFSLMVWRANNWYSGLNR